VKAVGCFLLVGLFGCEARRPPADTSSSHLGEPDLAGAARARVGIVVVPVEIRVGDTVGGLAVAKVDVRRAVVDSVAVGSIVFRGVMELEGYAIPHFDSDARGDDGGAAACFEADQRSAARMPRWSGDRRRPWFCFTNPDRARRALATIGAPDSDALHRTSRIRVDSFTIHRGLSDEVNSAHFVEVVADAACYRSPHSVLLGPSAGRVNEGHAPGWMRLERGAESGGGVAELRDANGAGFSTRWTARAGDTAYVDARDDFLRTQIWFVIRGDSLHGRADAYSDATLEGDSSGALSELHRTWPLSAGRAPCENFPGGL
jgi:hypothetical protein